MKKAMRKFASILLSLVLLLSMMPIAALAEETEHVHTFVPSVGTPEYEYVDDDCHKVVNYTNYDCECGEDSFRVKDSDVRYDAHKASPIGVELQGSYIDENGNIVYTYRYTCLQCLGSFLRNEYQ